jgi:primosomal protein N' (replication factor Y) (superfamily II helicase)
MPAKGIAMISRFAEIAVLGPMRQTFTYTVPDQWPDLAPGQRVLVPFGRTRKLGFVLGPGQPPAGVTLKHVSEVIDPRACLSPELLSFCRWMADYYFCNPAAVLTAALPPRLKLRRGPQLLWNRQEPSALPDSMTHLVTPGRPVSRAAIVKLNKLDQSLLGRLLASGEIVEHWPTESTPGFSSRLVGYRLTRPEIWPEFFKRRRLQPGPFDGVKPRAHLHAAGWTDHLLRHALKSGLLEAVQDEQPPAILDFIDARSDVTNIVPNAEQAAVINDIGSTLGEGFNVHLIHGVTGSGKTLIYCHLAREVLRRGHTVLVLTPEIALTGAILAYFRGFFGDQVTVIHSAMHDQERMAGWLGTRQGRFRVVVGPRSAVFAPLKDIGLIIVDEEHDSSYKQHDPAPRFQGRDAAIMRAKMANVPVVLGSASPSVESYYHATRGRYRLHRLTSRPQGATLPTVRLIDMRPPAERLGGRHWFLSYALKRAVEERLSRGEQVILFLNRRGYAPQLKCLQCGRVPECPNCRVKLTYHKSPGKLSCHYCGYVVYRYDRCSHCDSIDLIAVGAGTQRVEETIPTLFEHARAMRLDSDSAAGRARAWTILNDFAQHKGNLLLGTQMVTKGLDLPDVTLVGVLCADMSLDIPDFRASEKAFSRLLQVAGRSGRAAKPGEVFIQTFYPDHPVIADAAAGDYDSFFAREIEARQPLSYPPFSRLIRIVFSSPRKDAVENAANRFAEGLRRQCLSARLRAELMGPAECPMRYLKGQHRRQLIIRTRHSVSVVNLLSQWEHRESRFGLPSSVKVVVDVDPHDMM